MQTQTRVLVTFMVLVGLIAGMYFFSDWFSKVTGYILGNSKEIELANCLREKGTVLYITENCVECYNQEQLLGERAISLLERQECTDTTCLGIRHFPAWEIEGKFYYGNKTLQELQTIAQCEIAE